MTRTRGPGSPVAQAIADPAVEPATTASVTAMIGAPSEPQQPPLWWSHRWVRIGS